MKIGWNGTDASNYMNDSSFIVMEKPFIRMDLSDQRKNNDAF